MKKIFCILIVFFMVGCVGPGAGDYSIKLINNYEVIRINSRDIVIAIHDSDVSWHTVIPPKVLQVGMDDRYIVALIQPIEDEDVVEVIEDEKKQLVYILDTQSNQVLDPITMNEFSKSEYNEIELKDINSYEKSYE